MDYDCLTSGTSSAPEGWDSCGVNHAYPSSYSFAGC